MTRICEETLPLLGPLDDGELPPAQAGQVSLHLAVCSRCATRRTLLAAQGAGLRERIVGRAAAASMDGFTDGVLARVARERRAQRPWDRLTMFREDTLRPHRLGFGVGASGLALAACLALAIFLRPAGGETPFEELASAAALNEVPQAEQASIEELEYDDNSNGAVLQLHGRNAPDGPATTVIWLSDGLGRAGGAR